MKNTSLFHKDSHAVSLQIDEIRTEARRMDARDELSHLEDLYEVISKIEDAPIDFMFCDIEEEPFLIVNNIEIYSVTDCYRMVIPSPPTQIQSYLDTNAIKEFLQGIYSPVGMAA